MALAAQALEAKKAWKPLGQGRALERGTARINRVMGLTFDMSGRRKAAEQPFARPLDGRVMSSPAQASMMTPARSWLGISDTRQTSAK